MKINKDGIDTGQSKPIGKYEMILIIIFGLLGALAYFIHYTVDNRSMVGAYILGVLTVMVMWLIFWTMNLISAWVSNTWEQKRFQDNAKENYANLLAQQKLQNEQTRGALMLSDNARKHQPQDEESYLVFDDALFDDLGGE